MKRFIYTLLVLVLCMMLVGSALAENRVADYSQKIKSATKWKCVDHNCVYSNSAKSVLPDLFNDGASFRPSSARIFGDDTGEVWMIYQYDVYRIWFDENNNVVLTSTSDGLGYSGYAVFQPE